MNKDGYIDIITECFSYDTAAIFWGSPGGYSVSNRTLLPTLHAQHNLEVADLNKDGWYEIIICNDGGSVNYIYWGSPGGYSEANRTSLPTPSGTPHGLSVADLDNNGWLDLIFTQFNGTEAYIYWGSEAGFSSTDVTVLSPGSCHGGSSVADFNKDGFLDILFFRGSWSTTYVQSVIYWGSSSGFSETNKTTIGPSINASGGLVADLNQDGSLDIFINNLIANNYDYVLYGPQFNILDSLPIGVSDLHGMFREIGNVYDREYYEEYISSVLGDSIPKKWFSVSWDDSLPYGTSIEMYIRTGNTETVDSSWSEWIKVQKDSALNIGATGYIQYKAVLRYTNPAYLPVLWEVRINYNIEAIFIHPDQEDTIIPGQSLDYTFYVENFTPVSRVVNIIPHGMNSLWSYEFYDSTGANNLLDTNGDGFLDVGVVDSQDTVKFIMRVMCPSTALFGQSDTVILKAVCADDSTLFDTASVITIVGKYVNIKIESDTVDSIDPGTSILVPLFGRNQGDLPDIIDITLTQNNPLWTLQLYDSTGINLLQDSDGDGFPDLGVQAPYTSRKFYLLVQPSPNAVPQEADTVWVYGYSTQNTAIYDSALIIIKIKGAKLIEVEPDTTGFLYPGDSVDYCLRCWNLDTSGNVVELTPLYSNLEVTFLDTLGNPLPDNDADGYSEIGYIAPETYKSFIVRVKSPYNTSPGVRDTLLVYGAFDSDTTIKDYARVITEIKNPYGIDLYPDTSGTCIPGGSLIYSLHVRNTGVRIDTVELTLQPLSVGFGHEILNLTDIDNDGKPEAILEPGQDSVFDLRVIVPDSIYPGREDTLRVKGESQGFPGIIDNIEVITLVVPSQVSISIAPDTHVRVSPSGKKEVEFEIQVTGLINDVVELPVNGGKTGWFLTLRDSSGSLLEDYDNDGIVEIGRVEGGDKVTLRALISAPDVFDSVTYWITARFELFPEIKDSAFLKAEIIPELNFHNFPNPVRDKTTFCISLSSDGDVFVGVYTKEGIKVATVFEGKMNAGLTEIEWRPLDSEGKRLKPGTYVVLFRYVTSSDESEKIVKKIVILP